MRLALRYLIVPLLLVTGIPLPSFAGGEVTVNRSVVEDMKAVFATVETADVILARARIGGTLGKLSIDEGSRVEKDQVIAIVGDPKIKLRMEALQARIQSVKSRRKLARTDLERAKKLFQSGTVPQKRLDEAETAQDVIEREFTALTADLSVMSQQKGEGVVLAPVGGRVTKVHVSEGAVLLPGETVATIAAKGFILRMMLPERHARYISVGDAVQIGERGLSGDGAIAKTGTIAQVYPELRNGRVVADISVDGLGDFFVGERVSVYVATGKRQTIIIPQNYTTQRYGLTFVRLKDGGEIVVQPGEKRADGIEILSGLNPGDVLVDADVQ